MSIPAISSGPMVDLSSALLASREAARREPTMSMRLVLPFVAAAVRSGVDTRTVRFLSEADPDSRLPASTAIGLLRMAVEMTGDEELGLLAALETTVGDYGGFEYAAGSCSTVGEALDFLCQSYFLIDEASTLLCRVSGGRVRLSFVQPDELFCRAAVDFSLAMLYLGYVRWVGRAPEDYEVWIPYPRPARVDSYARIFGAKTPLHFDAPDCGVEFGEADLSLPLQLSDAKLHGLLTTYVERRYAVERPGACVVDSVRRRIVQGLPEGGANVRRVAAAMGMSRRTLARKLDREGTTFRQILADVRCATAVRCLLLDTMSIERISEQLGYSEPAAFHRAFRSWFGESPSAFRARRVRPRGGGKAVVRAGIPTEIGHGSGGASSPARG